jgi:hypothetical protein
MESCMIMGHTKTIYLTKLNCTCSRVLDTSGPVPEVFGLCLEELVGEVSLGGRFKEGLPLRVGTSLLPRAENRRLG